MKLRSRQHTCATATGRYINRALLVRVFAVTQQRLSVERDKHHGWKRSVGLDVTAEPRRDGRVIYGRMGKRGGRELLAQFQGRSASAKLGNDRVVLSRLGGDRRKGVILGGGADQAGSADVDVLNGFGGRDAGAGDRLLERIEIDHNKVE